MATIADVARAAGVSRSTVSHALSGKRPISGATKERISRAIKDLNYTANARAKALATAKSAILGLIVPFSKAEFAPATLQYVLAIVETARSAGYDVLIVAGEEGVDGIRRVTASALVDGLIVLDIKRQDERVGAMGVSGRPAVLLGVPDDVAESGVDAVDLDFFEAGRLLLRHLAEQGHREIVFVTMPEEVFAADLAYAWRFRGAVVAEAARLGVAVRLLAADVDPAERRASIGRMLDERGSATALLVHNDAALVELRDLLDQRNLAVPGDLAVASLFPAPFGQTFSLPYTAIETSAEVAAERAVRLLVDRIESPGRPAVCELIEPHVIDRGTSARTSCPTERRASPSAGPAAGADQSIRGT